MHASSPAPSISTMLERIGQTQAPSWLVLQHVDTMAHEGTHALVGSAMGRRRSRPAGYGRAADLFRLTSRPLEGAG
jgi:hypothetical protein